MKTTFHPADLQSFDGMVAGIIDNGSAFVHMNSGDRIYVPSRIIEGKGIQVGDSLRCWCIPNDHTNRDSVKYKAIRALVQHRLVEHEDVTAEKKVRSDIRKIPEAMTVILPDGGDMSSGVEVADEQEGQSVALVVAPPKAPPVGGMTSDEVHAEIDMILDQMGVYSAKDIYAAICRKYPAMFRDPKFLTRIVTAMNSMSDRGDVATARLYSQTTQVNPSAVFYARNVVLIEMRMKGEIA